MALDVTDRDEMTSGTRLSQSVTSGIDFAELLLQIEIFLQTGPVCLDL